MMRPFQLVNQRRGPSIVAVQHRTDPEWNRLDDEWLFSVRPCGSGQPEPKQAVDGSLEGIARAADLLVQELRYIVVDGERRAHIMMLD